MTNAWTTDNTEGYSQEELDALNAELARRLAVIDPNDTDAINEATKAFADEAARR